MIRKLLANENIPLASITLLQKAGFEVFVAARECTGASDEAILNRARTEGRIILTFDRDYGELIFRRQLPVPPAVVYLRFIPSHPEEVSEVFQQILSQTDIDGYFITAHRDRLRRRRLSNR